ncbi:murein biosynthesis integral membrane protein MurJ [Candidatus Peregrinibacteria bacterium]|nr:murein biosynthesis integral membrane protein MurJ [Candidatus Peregrinibacteria bacterium]
MQERLLKATTLGKATILVSVTAFISYVIGLLRDRIIAINFGTTAITDTYNASFLIPDILFNLFIAGALSASFLPVFSDYLNRDKNEASKIANTMLTTTTIAIAFLAAVAHIFMPQIIPLIFKEATAAMQTDIIGMTRLMLLSAIFFAISNTLGNILMGYKHFFSYAVAPILYNIGIIFGIIFLKDKIGIYSAATGVVVGAALHAIIRIMDTLKTGYKYRPELAIKHPGFRQIIKLMVPRSISLIVWHLNMLIFAKVGIDILKGGFSAFNYARNIQSFAVSLFGIAFATAVFPYLADTVTANDEKKYTGHIQKTIERILFFTIPSAAALMFLTKPVVEILLGGGAFDEKSVRLTSALLFFFAISIPFESLVQILSRAFYARKNTVTPMIINIISAAIIASITYFIAPKFGIEWFSIGFTVGFIFYVIVALLCLKKHLKQFNFRQFLVSISKTIVASGLMVAIILITQPLENILPIKLAHIIRIIIGGAGFFLAAYLIKSPELKSIFRKPLKNLRP